MMKKPLKEANPPDKVARRTLKTDLINDHEESRSKCDIVTAAMWTFFEVKGQGTRILPEEFGWCRG
jgi:hypothetical protein|eukprot:scaffold7117_cov199-Alexandrium_tamarense.AAC.6